MKLNHAATSSAESISSSARRAFRLVEHIASGGQTSNLSELSRTTGVARVTAMRLIEDLEDAGIIEPLPGGGHRVGPPVMRIAALTFSGEDLYSLGQRTISDLGDALGLSAYLVIPQHRDVLYIRKHLPATPLVSNISIGSLIPAHLSAPGRAILSRMSAPAVRKLLGSAPLEPSSTRGPSTLTAVLADLAEVRDAGCAWSYSGLEPGIDACAAAVMDRGGSPVAAISVAGPEPHFAAPGIHEKVQASVIRAAEELTTFSSVA